MNQAPLAQLLEACGATEPLRLSVAQTGKQGAVPKVFPRPFVVAGRSNHAHLTLDDTAVSQRHVYLQVIGGRVFCFDLRSRRGIRLSGIPQSWGWLSPSRTLRVGPFDLRLLGGTRETPPGSSDDTSPLLRVSPEQDTLPGVTLEATSRGTAGRVVWRMSRVLALVGRATDCKVRVLGPGVSKFQCSLLRTRGGLWVIDLLAEGGVRINGTQVPWARLDDGDELQVGATRFRVRYDAPGRAAGSCAPTGLTASARPADPAGALSNLGAAPPASGRTGSLATGTVSGRQWSWEGALLPAGLGEERSEWAPLLGALTHQFSLVQQQTFEQMTQVLMMMAKMFGQMHESQMRLFREELDRLHQVTRELHGLQADLARDPAGPQGAVASTRRSKLPLESVPAAAGAPRKPATAPSGAGLPQTGGQPQQAPASGDGQPGEDIHALLCERMAALQEERQSRWQTILQFLVGKAPGKAG